jgi:hypothetical protein
MDQIVFFTGLTCLVFGGGLGFFLSTNYSRRLLFTLEQEEKALQEKGDAAGAQAAGEEIVLLRVLAPRYARLFLRTGLVLLALYFLLLKLLPRLAG